MSVYRGHEPFESAFADLARRSVNAAPCDCESRRASAVEMDAKNVSISTDEFGAIYRCDFVSAEPVSKPDKLGLSQVELSGFTGGIEFGEPIEGTVELFEFPEELKDRIAELHLDVLATADEMRAELARQGRVFQTMLTALIVVTLLLALLSLKLVGGGA